jgi:hypothetical protein
MADYTPLIQRAVEGLENNTGENRRVLYERARVALTAQLRGMEPPLEESEITRERLALEEAIRNVEGEAVKRSREHNGGGDFDEALVAPSQRSLTDEALAGFRETMAEAEGIGDAAAQANKSARTFYPDEQAAQAESEAPPIDEQPSFPGDHQPSQESPGEELERTWHAPPPAPDEDEATYRPRRSYRGLVTTVIILLQILGNGAAGYWQRTQVTALANKAMTLVTSLRGSSSPKAPPQQREATQAQPKITDRVAPQSDRAGANRPAAAPAADVAQKVVLYEEDTSNPQGKRFVGSVIWRTETVSPGPGLAPELAIRADVEIPERRMRMTWSMRRNTDKALPASHTIEIMFTLPADFPEGGLQNVPGVLVKQNEQTRGVPLAGLAVKVTNGFFLVGLNSSEVDLARNIALLKERPWFDVPIVYNTGKRALLAIEKGTPGERAFEDAFRAWGQ